MTTTNNKKKEKTNGTRKWVAKAASKEATFGRRRVKTQTVCGHADAVQRGDSAVQKKNREEQQAGGAEADEPDEAGGRLDVGRYAKRATIDGVRIGVAPEPLHVHGR